MPGTAGPNLGLTWGWAAHESGWGLGGFNPDFARLDTLVNGAIISVLSAAPGSPANGDRYIVGAAPSGAFSGHADEIAVYLTIGTPAWLFLTPKTGWRVFNIATVAYLRWSGSAWINDAAPNIFNLTSLANRDVFHYDSGTSKIINGRPKHGFGFNSDPASVHTADQILLNYPMPTDISFVANFGAFNGLATTAYGVVAATGSTTFLVKKALLSTPTVFSNVGTVVIGAGGVVVSSLTTTGGVQLDFAAGDIFRLVAPTVPDATLKGTFGIFVGFEA